MIKFLGIVIIIYGIYLIINDIFTGIAIKKLEQRLDRLKKDHYPKGK